MQRITVQGPLPAPHLLRQYEEIHPGFTNRLLTAVEEQGKHRRAMDQPTLDANLRLARFGQIIGGTVCLAALGCGTYLVSIGNNPVGIALMFSAVATVVAPFMFRFKRRTPRPNGETES